MNYLPEKLHIFVPIMIKILFAIAATWLNEFYFSFITIFDIFSCDDVSSARNSCNSLFIFAQFCFVRMQCFEFSKITNSTNIGTSLNFEAMNRPASVIFSAFQSKRQHSLTINYFDTTINAISSISKNFTLQNRLNFEHDITHNYMHSLSVVKRIIDWIV